MKCVTRPRHQTDECAPLDNASDMIARCSGLPSRRWYRGGLTVVSTESGGGCGLQRQWALQHHPATEHPNSPSCFFLFMCPPSAESHHRHCRAKREDRDPEPPNPLPGVDPGILASRRRLLEDRVIRQMRTKVRMHTRPVVSDPARQKESKRAMHRPGAPANASLGAKAAVRSSSGTLCLGTMPCLS